MVFGVEQVSIQVPLQASLFEAETGLLVFLYRNFFYFYPKKTIQIDIIETFCISSRM